MLEDSNEIIAIDTTTKSKKKKVVADIGDSIITVDEPVATIINKPTLIFGTTNISASNRVPQRIKAISNLTPSKSFKFGK